MIMQVLSATDYRVFGSQVRTLSQWLGYTKESETSIKIKLNILLVLHSLLHSILVCSRIYADFFF
jgi:hypothetical protein